MSHCHTAILEKPPDLKMASMEDCEIIEYTRNAGMMNI